MKKFSHLAIFALFVLAGCVSEKTMVADKPASETVENTKSAEKAASIESSSPAYPSCNTPGVTCDLSGRVIYGPDNRKDWYQIDPSQQALASSVVSVFKQSNIDRLGDGNYKLDLRKYGLNRGLCTSEAFYEQMKGASCSGALVYPDTILTAGHCVKPPSAEPISSQYFIFGFRANDKDDVGSDLVPAESVYRGQQLLGRQLLSDGTDWALVKLDRTVPASVATPLAVNPNLRLNEGQSVFVIGHPVGLPVKFADGAEIRSLQDKYVVANLDTYGGNSGSPVFDEATNEVIGVLVRGETDFVYCMDQPCYRSGECQCPSNCMVSNVCPTSGCNGEDVMRVAEIDLIK